MSNPVVYLDNSDYSRIADALNGRGQQHLVNVFELLVKAARDHRAKFCFSYMIAAEAFQLSSGQVEIASRKAEVIEALCGTRAFPNPVWLLRLELIESATRLGFSCSSREALRQPLVENGLWVLQDFPRTEADLDELTLFSKANMEEAAAEHGTPRMNRRARRAMKAIVSRATTTRGSEIRAQIEKLPTCKALFEIGQEQMVWEMLSGRAAVGDLTRRLVEEIGRPTVFVKMHQRIHDFSWLNNVLSKFNREIKLALDQLLHVMWSWPLEQQPKDLSSFRLLATPYVDKMILGIARRQENYFLEGGVDQSFLSSSHFDDAVRLSKFNLTFKGILVRLLWTAFSAGQGAKGIEDSHGGDVLHAAYLPYCHFWRTDRGFSNVAAQVGKDFGCVVVPKLEDLPALLAI